MSAKRKTFIELLAAGKAKPSEVDAFVAAWHKGSDPRELHAALGLTPAQYAKWVRGDSSISEIADKLAKKPGKLAFA